MEFNVVDFFNNQNTIGEIFSYYFVEISCVVLFVLNLILLFLPKKNRAIAKISDLFVFATLMTDLIISIGIQIFNFFNLRMYEFDIFNGLFSTNQTIFIEKSLINLFFLFFLLSQYKINRKYRCYALNLNLILVLIILCANLLLQVNNFVVGYILLLIIMLLTYKYGSTMNLKKDSIFCEKMIMISTVGIVLFFLFYVSGFVVKDDIQIKIINSCIILAYLLNTGIFPVFNYSYAFKNKFKMPFIILAYLLVPFCAVKLLPQLLENIGYQSNIFQLVLAIVLSVIMFSFALQANKDKNILKFIIHFGYVEFIFCAINKILFNLEQDTNALLYVYLFAILAIYSLLTIVKISYPENKINYNLLRGIANKNDKFACISSCVLLFCVPVFPSLIASKSLYALKNVYLFDKYTFIIALLYICSCALILFGILKIIFAMYEKKSNFEFKKGMTLNYIIPILIMFIFVFLMFL